MGKVLGIELVGQVSVAPRESRARMVESAAQVGIARSRMTIGRPAATSRKDAKRVGPVESSRAST